MVSVRRKVGGAGERSNLRRLLVAVIGVAAAIGGGTEASAAFVPLNVVSGTAWLASCQGGDPGTEGSCSSTAIPAYAPYPNEITRLDPSTTNAELMWYWDLTDPGNPTPLPTGANGPHGPIDFSTSFNLASAPNPGDLYGAWIAADDFMSLNVNGSLAGSYVLDQHKDAQDQPVPVFVDFTFLLHAGTNDISILACDGVPGSCHDRAFEWAFIDAERGPEQAPAFVAIPEPSTVRLLGAIALITMVLRRRLRN
jgi:hypothetical protein